METVGYPRPLSAFDMKEIYRLIRNERIPGFNMLGKERRYLDEYREALKRVMETENEEIQVETVEAPKKTSKKRKSSRKEEPVEEPVEEPEIELPEISEEVEEFNFES